METTSLHQNEDHIINAIDDDFENGEIKEENFELPLSQNTMHVLTQDLALENLDNLVVLSQGSSQKSIGDVHATLAVSTFEQHKIVKATPWIYSKALDRLFLRPNEKVPLRFTCQGTYSRHMKLLVFLRYWEVQYQNEQVEVCPNHLRQNQRQNLPHPRHVMQYCGERTVTYLEPPETADFGIQIPLLQTAFEPSGQTENFSFVCLSSCMMIGRKKTSLCAELHYQDQVLSKVEIPLKISVCPMRDMNNEEGKNNALTTSLNGSHSKPQCTSASSSKRARITGEGPDSSFGTIPVISEMVVRVKGRKFVEELKAFLATKIPAQHYVIYTQDLTHN